MVGSVWFDFHFIPFHALAINLGAELGGWEVFYDFFSSQVGIFESALFIICVCLNGFWVCNELFPFFFNLVSWMLAVSLSFIIFSLFFANGYIIWIPRADWLWCRNNSFASNAKIKGVTSWKLNGDSFTLCYEFTVLFPWSL